MVETIWQEFLKIVSQEVGSRIVETWFKAVHLVLWDSNAKVAYLHAPNDFVKTWIVTHYQDLCKKPLARLLGEESIKVHIAVEGAQDGQFTIVAARKLDHATNVSSSSTKMPLTVPSSKHDKIALVKKKQKKPAHVTVYTFESFVVGPSNELAFSAAYAVAQNPGMHYNPLFLYGGSGLGKTHLLYAISAHVHEKSPEKVVYYETADRFVQNFIQAIRLDKMAQFQAQYRRADVLLIDDIQFISKKEQTQEAFFHIFNLLHQSHKQIVLTADCMPRDIAGLAERMRTRLEWGLVADIHMPLLETRMAILKKKAEAYSASIDDEAFSALASYDFSNVRELEGALVRVLASAALADCAVTKEFIEKIIKPVVRVKETVDIASIARTVCRCAQLNLHELRSSTRTKELVVARHVAMFLMKRMTDASLREIGSFFNKKDHSTVIHAIEKIETKGKKIREISLLIKDVERCLEERS